MNRVSFVWFCYFKGEWCKATSDSHPNASVPHLYSVKLITGSYEPPAVPGCALPQGYAVLVHGLLVLIDSHQEVPQDAVQDTVTLVGQGIPQQGNPIFILLLSACAQAKLLL